MTGNIVAQRYAQALFSIAKEENMASLEQCSAVLEDFTAALSVSKDLQRALRAPVITALEKERLMLTLLQKFDAKPLMVRFCKLLVERNRLDLLPSIALAFTSLLNEAKGLLCGHVTTAIALEKKEQTSIVTSLEAKSTKTLQLDFTVDKELLGGIVLQIGDIVLDASLRAQLARLKDTMTQVDN